MNAKEYIKNKVERTNFPFMNVNKIRLAIGYYPKDELNEMYKNGEITIHKGLNHKIVRFENDTKNKNEQRNDS